MDDRFINPFASKEYHFLCWLSDHQTMVARKQVIKFSQKEIAVEYGNCETTVNRMLTTLRRAGCIASIKNGNYSVTSRGYEVIAKMNELEKVLGGKNNGG